MSMLPSHVGQLGLRDIFQRIPDQAIGIVRFYQALMRGPSEFSAGQRELFYSYCSKLNGCHFAHTSHKAAAIGLGIPAAVFDMAPDALDRAPLPPAAVAALRYDIKLTLQPAQVTAADKEPLRAAGLSETAVIDAAMVGALVGYIDRVLDGLGASSPDEMHRRNGENLAMFGYLRVEQEVEKALSQPQDAPPAAAAALPGLAALAEKWPDRRWWLVDYFDLLMTGPSEIEAEDRRRIVAAGSATLRGGAPGGWVERAMGPVSPSADKRLAPLLAYARKLTRDPGHMNPEDAGPVYAAGWSEAALIGLVGVTAYQNFLDRLDLAVGL